MRLLLIDNIDSFTFNLYHYFLIAGCEVKVVRNSDLSQTEMRLLEYDAAVLSPGPGRPADSENLMEFVSLHYRKKPIFGVCLGMQAIAEKAGWNLKHAHIPRHGKPSSIQHHNRGIFEGLPNPLQAGRYHSLIVEPGQAPTDLQIEAECDGEIMAISSPDNLIWAVQFHPESILTPQGQMLIDAWVKMIKSLN